MSHLNGIRLVTFDVLYTIIFPRTPIHIQYARHFEPHIGRLDPDKIKSSFPIALKQVQKERPAYEKGTNAWWIEVIRRTAVSAGADEAGIYLPRANRWQITQQSQSCPNVLFASF